MTSYMLTVLSSTGARDVQVDNAGDIREAIELAESYTGCRVNHGRGGLGSAWHPAMTIDAESGQVNRLHDNVATVSMQVAVPPGARAMIKAWRAMDPSPD